MPKRKKTIIPNGWSEYTRWEQIVLALSSFPFVIAARVMWQIYPGAIWCGVFWLISLADEPVRWRFLGVRRRFCYGLAYIGGLSNAAATLVNGGVMPVLNLKEQTSFWVPLTSESRLFWLCDIYWEMASVGDFLIFAGLVALLIVWLAEKWEWVKREPVAINKRLPGLGIG